MRYAINYSPSEVRYANSAAEFTFFDLSELWEYVSFKGVFNMLSRKTANLERGNEAATKALTMQFLYVFAQPEAK